MADFPIEIGDLKFVESLRSVFLIIKFELPPYFGKLQSSIDNLLCLRLLLVGSKLKAKTNNINLFEKPTQVLKEIVHISK